MEYFPHIGHDLRRGPLLKLKTIGFACITCKVVGEVPHGWLPEGVPAWTDEDYYANVDWIEV